MEDGVHDTREAYGVLRKPYAWQIANVVNVIVDVAEALPFLTPYLVLPVRWSQNKIWHNVES
jgi:hypothetical protein